MVVMAQAGCFVPAQLMSLAPMELLFTRMGTGDCIETNSSSFMLEMQVRGLSEGAAKKRDEMNGYSCCDAYLLMDIGHQKTQISHSLISLPPPPSQEVAHILHHASPHSLVLIDELGRATSTADGVAIAWAVAEHLALDVGCATLLSTHFR